MVVINFNDIGAIFFESKFQDPTEFNSKSHDSLKVFLKSKNSHFL